MKSVAGRQKNIWDIYAKQLAEHAQALSETLAKQMLGGVHPPGTVPVPRSVQLRQFLLLSTPRAQLPPEQAAEVDALWERQFAGRSEIDIKMWALDMAREYTKLTAPGPGEMVNPAPLDSSGMGLDAEPDAEPEITPFGMDYSSSEDGSAGAGLPMD